MPVIGEKHFYTQHWKFHVQHSNFQKNCLGSYVYRTSNFVLILAVNINVNFQIKLNSSKFKENFSIFIKLKVVFYIPLIPKASKQIAATRKQILSMTIGVYSWGLKKQLSCLISIITNGIPCPIQRSKRGVNSQGLT